jgi:hypothetical protein
MAEHVCPFFWCIAVYNRHRCDRGETDIIKASEAFVSGSIPDGRTNLVQIWSKYEGFVCRCLLTVAEQFLFISMS